MPLLGESDTPFRCRPLDIRVLKVEEVWSCVSVCPYDSVAQCVTEYTDNCFTFSMLLLSQVRPIVGAHAFSGAAKFMTMQLV